VGEFVVSLEKSEYPIDALLFLVKEKKIDIRELKLADIANEFMEFVERMNFTDLELMSDFIALASDLIKIKSFSLIPSKRTYVRNIENRIKTSLEEREKLLRKAKEVAAFAKFMESVRPVNSNKKNRISRKTVISVDFQKAFNMAKRRIDFREKLKYISSGKFSISSSIKKLKEYLSLNGKIEFANFISSMEKMEKISYIVAALEIIKEDFARLEETEKIIIIKN
jgi:segregation and condensation protein A